MHSQPTKSLWRLCFVVAGISAVGASDVPIQANEPNSSTRIALTIELGPDRGQNPGSLFEINDANGRVVAGAGFSGSYNTQPRSDREQLQLFVRGPERQDSWQIERMPAVDSPSRGFYPFSLGEELYLLSRGGPDSRIRRWDRASRQWIVDAELPPYVERVAGKRLWVTPQAVIHDGRILRSLADKPERFGEHYYAGGNLILREYSASSQPVVNRLVVCPWQPEVEATIEARPEWTYDLTIPTEFVYAFGQWHNHVIVATNVGRVLRFDGEGWQVLREHVPNVSYQIYAALNYYDRLLLGHYPTGEIYEYAGSELKLRKGWPPAIPGVSSNAREAQSLAIYGGDLHVGVWPWGEVWRYDGDRSTWKFSQRMFTHPAPNDKLIHPYEAETKSVEKIANLWGQRVTGLLPIGTDLVITTSSKTGAPWEPRFDFLSAEQQADYGATYRATLPGNLAVATTWKTGPTRFEFAVTADALEIRQDAMRLGTLPLTADLLEVLRAGRITWGKGVFGPFAGRIVERSSSLAAEGLPRPFLGAYFHPDRFLPRDSDQATQEKTLRENVVRYKSSGLNVIMPYFTGSSGQAYYASDILKERVYTASDPMSILMREARAHGLQVHAVVCIAVCGNEKPAGILLEHPEWGCRHPDGSPLGYISPAHPDARAWIVTVLREIVARYQPDGIVLDYIRYHNRPLRLDPAAEERFQKSLPPDRTPAEEQQLLQAFKEADLTELVRQISTGVRTEHPGTKVSIYGWGPHVAKNHQIAQVWPTWVERGYLDMVNISGYYHHDKYGEKYLKLFEQRMLESLELNRRQPRPVPITFALGVNTSHGKVRSADDIRRYLEVAGRLKMAGVAFFPWNNLAPYLDELDKTGEIPAFPAAGE